jgi:hypothetical protein
MVEDLIKRLREQSQGRVKWFAMNKDESAYFIDFHTTWEAGEWMERQKKHSADWLEREGVHMVEKRIFTELEELAKQAADALEQKAALESERDALLAAAGKEAVAEPVMCETIFSEVTKWVDAHHISFDAQNELFKALSGVLANAAPNPWEALFDRVALELNCLPSSFADGNEHVFQAIEKLRTAPAAALEKGDGRDAEWLAEVCEDADGTKHIEAVVEELDDIPTGTRLYAGTHMAWRPIETAPKDGTWILMTNGVDVAGGQWIRDEGGTTEYRDEDGRYLGQDDRDDFEGWMDWMGGIPRPTHWSPLPAPPAALSQKAGEQQ